MATEIIIICAYFFVMGIPVATVIAFLRIQADPERARRFPVADSYYMPGEGTRATRGHEDTRLLTATDGSVSKNHED